MATSMEIMKAHLPAVFIYLIYGSNERQIAYSLQNEKNLIYAIYNFDIPWNAVVPIENHAF